MEEKKKNFIREEVEKINARNFELLKKTFNIKDQEKEKEDKKNDKDKI